MKYYQAIAHALHSFKSFDNPDIRYMKREYLDSLIRDLPSGSGWDIGTRLDWDESTSQKLIFHGSFHHMSETGMYSGWTDHKIIVRPCLLFDFVVDVTGRNRNGIKDYLTDLFYNAFSEDAPEI